MCLAIPVKIEALLEYQQARVSLSGVKTNISVALIEDPQPGDYVILHVGYALNKLNPEEAEATLKLFAENPDEGQLNP